MKKYCLLLLLFLTLLGSAVGCRSKAPPEQTREEELSSAPSIEASPESTTPHQNPSVRPAPEWIASAVESFLLNDEPYLPEGEITEALAACEHTIYIKDGFDPLSLSVSGWVGFTQAIDSFGYRIDSEETVYALFATQTEEALLDKGGPYTLRYTVTVPLFTLKPGGHTVTLLARLADGTEIPLLPTLTLRWEGPTVDPTVPYHSALTAINGSGAPGESAYTGRGGSLELGMDILDAATDGKTVGRDGSLRVSGWLALEGGVERYVWSADGVVWFPAQTNGQTGEPAAGHFASLGYENATENALFTDLLLDLSPYDGKTVWITLGGVPKNAPDSVVPFMTITGLEVPRQPEDIPFRFTGLASDNPIGTDLSASDLTYLFDFRYGAGELRRVDLYDDAPCYLYEGIHSFQTAVSGQYAMTARVLDMGNASFFFVRGTREVLSVEPVQLSLLNYYETDGAGLCGGAGIYARLAQGKVTLVIKGLDPGTPYRVRNYVYEFPAEGSELTLADNGSTVFILVDGQTVARVVPEGETEYPEHFARISPYIQFAATATVYLPDGRSEVIRDTLIAATCVSECGAAIRGGHIYFSEISVVPLSEYPPLD